MKARAPASRLGGTVLMALAALVGGLLATATQAPARWLADWVSTQTRAQVRLSDSRGTLWQGSAQAELSAGLGGRDAARLPGRTHWQWGWQDGAAVLRLRVDCCSDQAVAVRVQPGWGRWRLSLPDQATPLLRLPAAWLAGLGTPWNTLQLGGQLHLSAQGFALQGEGGRWTPQGALQLDLLDVSSRVATVAPLGSYRLRLVPGTAVPLQLSTLQGALRLSGQGQLQPRLRFNGEAAAEPGAEGALNNLLNIVGRRDGARSLIVIG